MNGQRSVVFRRVVKIQRSVDQFQTLKKTGRTGLNRLKRFKGHIVVAIPATVAFERRLQIDGLFVLEVQLKMSLFDIVKEDVLVKK